MPERLKGKVDRVYFVPHSSTITSNHPRGKEKSIAAGWCLDQPFMDCYLFKQINTHNAFCLENA